MDILPWLAIEKGGRLPQLIWRKREGKTNRTSYARVNLQEGRRVVSGPPGKGPFSILWEKRKREGEEKVRNRGGEEGARERGRTLRERGLVHLG
eukprot:11561937-Heterocapsa_arctica.AAC.1